MTSHGIRVQELLLSGPSATQRDYGVSFRGTDGGWQGLSVIAGPTQTGKTSVADFIRYCLGDDEHPQHPEILTAVRSALIEVELAEGTVTIERAASGTPSKFASIWHGPITALSEADEERLSTDPPSDPSGLSQFVLSTFGLDGVQLPEAPTQPESRSQLLSIRDVFRLMFLPNERLDNKNLVYESSNYMIRQKFRQTIDVLFGVFDPEGATLSASIKEAAEAASQARRTADSLRAIVNDEYPTGPAQLDAERNEARDVASALRQELQALDQEQRLAEGALAQLRDMQVRSEASVTAASVRVRDRRSLLDRLTVLRAQYADDKKKMTFLKEAERLFDPLHVVACPACLADLATSPSVDHGKCSLCGSEVAREDTELNLGTAVGHPPDPPQAGADSTKPVDANPVLEAELRAVSRRLDELNDYWGRLNDDLRMLEDERSAARDSAEQAAEALNGIVDAPAPWLALRDDVSRRLSDARVRIQRAEAGLRLWARVEDAEGARDRLEVAVQRLREQRKEVANRPDRAAVVEALSARFGQILRDIGYPKLDEPMLDSGLVPHVRGLPYTSASSGGLVLISLAFHLAIWEVAYEQSESAPGLLVIDSPQKNLGHGASEADPEFADSQLVENFYAHVLSWLSGAGQGAQLIVIDNTPPESVARHVVAHYTRDPKSEPYGLIWDAVD